MQRIAACSCLPKFVWSVSEQTTQVVVEAFHEELCFGRSKALVVGRQKWGQQMTGGCRSLHGWSVRQKLSVLSFESNREQLTQTQAYVETLSSRDGAQHHSLDCSCVSCLL